MRYLNPAFFTSMANHEVTGGGSVSMGNKGLIRITVVQLRFRHPGGKSKVLRAECAAGSRRAGLQVGGRDVPRVLAPKDGKRLDARALIDQS